MPLDQKVLTHNILQIILQEMVSHSVTAAECKEVSKKYCAIIHFSTTMQLDLTLYFQIRWFI